MPAPALRAHIANALPTLREALWPGPATPEEEAAYASYQREVSVENIRSILMGSSLIALLWWPLDLIVAASRAEVWAFGIVRTVVIVVCSACWLSIGRSATLRRHVYGTAVATIAIGTGCASFVFARLGGPSHVYGYFAIITCFMLLMVPMGLRARVLSTFAIELGRQIGFFAADPAFVHDPATRLYVSFDTALSILCIVGGALAEVLRRRSFFIQEVAARQAEELRLIKEQLESRVEAQTGELRDLARHLDSTRERERTHLARELHDELGQELMALSYAVQVLRNRYDKEPAEVAQNIGELQTLLDRTRDTTRSLVSDLRPRVLDDLGLGAAAEWLVRRTADRTGLRCDADVPEGFLPISGSVATAAYRILQESLTNVARHAHATRASIRVALEQDELVLVIRDDGRGFTAGTGRAGFGLIGMRERAGAAGGTIQVESAPGRGTVVVARLPLENQPLVREQLSPGDLPGVAQDPAAPDPPASGALS